MSRLSKASDLATRVAAEAALLATKVIAEATVKATAVAADAAALAAKSAPEVAKVANDLASHEAICTERYGYINTALEELKKDGKALTKFMWSANGLLVVTLLAIVGYFFAQGWHK
jgi:hypothetical protein